MTLPNFYIAGGARCGSTSLEAYCRTHPQVYMSPVKEPNYFSYGYAGIPFTGPGRDKVYTTSIKDRRSYEKLFRKAGEALAVGEASINYMIHPEACAGIKAVTPDARIIFILRHPVERAWSSFHRSRFQGIEPEHDFLAAWRADQQRRDAGHWVNLHRYKSLYGMHLRPWYEAFSPDRILVIRFEDFKADAGAVMSRVYRFLGVDSSYEPDISVIHNQTGEIENPLLRQLWGRTEHLRAVLAPRLPLSWRGQAFRLVARGKVSRPDDGKIPPGLKAELTAELREDILALQELTGLQFDHWLD